MSNTTTSQVTEANTETAPEEAVISAPVEGKGYIKPKGHNPDKDWSYLVDKDPNETNTLYAMMVHRLTGVEISPKQVQVLLAMHRWMQASDLNRERETFRGRTWEEVRKGNATLLERAEDIITERGETAQVVDSPNVVDDELKAEAKAEVLKVRNAAAAKAEAAKAAKAAKEKELEAAKAAEVPAEEVAEEAIVEEAPKPKPQARKPRQTAAQKKAAAEKAAAS